MRPEPPQPAVGDLSLKRVTSVRGTLVRLRRMAFHRLAGLMG